MKNKLYHNRYSISYGWSSWTERDQWGNPYANSITGTINGITTNIASMSLYFLRNGYILNGTLGNAGSNGYYWSSTAYAATQAYNLLFDSSNVNPSNLSNRYDGNSVRCVAR